MSNIKTFQFQVKGDALGNDVVVVTIKENYSTAYSNFIWPCALVLSEFICVNSSIFRGKNVLELGCGTGICAIVASKVGSHIYLTDKFDCQQSLDLCRENVQLNKVQANLLSLEWGNIDGPLPKVDYIICSDCFYDEADFEDLLCTASLLLKHAVEPSRAAFYFAHQLRSSAHSIDECVAKKWNLKCKMIAFQAESQNDGRQVIEMYEIKLC